MSRRRAKRRSGPAAPSSETQAPARTTPRGWLLATGVFLVLLVAYLINGDILPGNDSKSNTFLPVSVLNEGNLSFTPEEMPFMFRWAMRTPRGVVPFNFNHLQWDRTVNGRTIRDHYQAGTIGVHHEMYYVVPSVRDGKPDRSLCVNTFGPGAGLCALPVTAVLQATSGDLRKDMKTLWFGAKFVAAAMVAASGALIFLTACEFTGWLKALAVALAYGLGTCVWSTSSQALWQHGPNEFFLALGALLLVRIDRGKRNAVLCGLAFACAVACRPTSVVVVFAVGVYLLVAKRRLVLPYVLGALPIALLLAGHNAYYFGSPFTFGQGLAGTDVALFKTGSAELWRRPFVDASFWVAAAGLLVSPSRGLLVYSPIMIFAFWGLAVVWRRKEYSAFRPLTVALVGLLGIAFCWFDWWGGWAYGYRPIVDTMPIFALLLIPVADAVFRRRWLAGVAAVLLVWSIGVQILGAWAYNLSGWNQKYTASLAVPGRREPLVVHHQSLVQRSRETGAKLLSQESVDIDQPANRGRLWSVSDCQILHYLRHFNAERASKREMVRQWIQRPET
jgi:hypothetical protein